MFAALAAVLAWPRPPEQSCAIHPRRSSVTSGAKLTASSIRRRSRRPIAARRVWEVPMFARGSLVFVMLFGALTPTAPIPGQQAGNSATTVQVLWRFEAGG
jgi:hypothetical protein